MGDTRYVKGFKIDRMLVAKLADVEDPMDPEVDAYIPIVVHQLYRPGYKFIASVFENDRTDAALVIALEVGYNREELENKALGEIDETIQWVKPHVLVGPGVWEVMD
jgi:hypothetical protein